MKASLDTINKQREIKQLIAQLGWSQRQFSGKYCIDESSHDIEENEINKFQETFKKQLKRTTTKAETLDKYIAFIKNTKEHKKLSSAGCLKEFVPLTGKFQDHSVILEEAKPLYRGILEVATAYALAVGTAWDFNIVPLRINDHEERFIVIWAGDIGHSGGSGSWGPIMCEVIKNHWGEYYVDTAEHFFDVKLRCITEVVDCFDNQLILVGRDYDTGDINNRPSLEYKVSLVKNLNNQWTVINKEFLRHL